MKKHVYLIIAFLCCSTITQGQLSQLVHLKTQPNYNRALQYHALDSIYSWVFSDPGEIVDISLLPNSPPYEVNTGYSTTYAIYDINLNPIHSFQIIQGSPHYEFIKKEDQKYIFNSNPILGAVPEAPFTSFPPLSVNYPSTNFSGYSSLLFNTEENPVLTLPFQLSWFYPGVYSTNPHQFTYFREAVHFHGQNYSKAAYVNDGHIITTITMLDDVVFNWEDTLNFGNNQWGTLWLKINPNNGAYVATPMLSNNGSVIPRTVFRSEDNEFIYRTATLNGHNLQVSPDGSVWENSPEDSLYHTFIVKENANGEQEWIRELFAYNDTWPDIAPAQCGISYAEQTPSLLELNNSIYLSNFIAITSAAGDSIYFRDFDGTASLHPLLDPSHPDFGNIAYAARTVYQINDQGQGIRTLRQPLPFYRFDDLNYSYARSEPYFFKVKDILGWSNTYRSLTDTTVYFLKNDLNGTIDSMAVDLPAGKGAYILWLDPDLNILETTNIPFSSPDYLIGVQITDASLFRNDTLLIMGTIKNGTTTSLDPEGLAEDITYTGTNSFVGFYTLPSVLNVANAKSPMVASLKIYPNPSNHLITVKSEFLAGAEYEVYDLSGKILLKGSLSNSNSALLNIETLGSGMYILKITGADGRSIAEKFLKG